MVVATNFEPPTEGIRHREPNTQALIRRRDLGKGTLLISESRVCWQSDSGAGFSLEYPAIQLHAVSRDPSLTPRPCLYLVVEGELPESTAATAATGSANGNGSTTRPGGTNGNSAAAAADDAMESGSPASSDEGNNGDDDSQATTEVRFIPPADDTLPAIYSAMCECQALHPDPCSDAEEEENVDDDNEDDEGGDGEEYDVEGAEANMGIQRPGDHGDKEPMDGQFDDAD